MKNPKSRETTDRDEMMCPRCQTEGLEADPYADEYNSKRAKLLKATRCSNEDCPYHSGVPRDKIEMQMPDSKMDIFSSILGGSISAKDAVIGLFIILSVLFMAMTYGIGPFGDAENSSNNNDQPTGTDPVVLQGSVFSNASDNAQILVYQDDKLVGTSRVQDGSYSLSLDEFGFGNYTAYIDYDNRPSPPGEEININSSETVLDFTETPEVKQIDLDETFGKSRLVLNYSNPTNTEDLIFSITPTSNDTSTLQREAIFNTSGENRVLMPVFPRSQEYTVEAPLTHKIFNDTNRYTGSGQQYRVRGNTEASSLQLTLPEETEADTVKRTFNVQQSGAEEQIEISGEQTVGPLEVVIGNGTSTMVEQITGEVTGDQNVTFDSGSENSQSGTIQISPKPNTRNRLIEGEINRDTIDHNFRGNTPIEDAQIEFTGGIVEEVPIADGSVSADAANGYNRSENQITEVSDSGLYRLNWTTSYDQNPRLVSTYYKINGNRTDVQTGGDSTLQLSQGDSISIGSEARVETRVDDSTPPDSASELHPDLNVESISFSNDNPSTEELVEVSVEIRNTGTSSVSDTVEIYQNKEIFATSDISLQAGETITLDRGDLGRPFTSSESGLSVWRVNTESPTYLKVGSTEVERGVGGIEATVSNVSGSGTVRVDSDLDGQLDCEVQADGGVCEFEQLQSGQNSIDVDQIGVSQTSYRIEYSSQENPEGVTVDVGGDGITDISEPNVLSEVVSTPVELPAGGSEIEFSVANDVPISYGIEWRSDSVVNNPVVYVDGELQLSDVGTFVSDTTFELTELDQGTHNIRFLSDGGGYDATLQWQEEGSNVYPEAYIDGQKVCSQSEFADNLTCSVDNSNARSPGQHTVEFRNSPVDSFNYQIQQNATAVASNVNIDVNGQRSDVFSRPTLEAERWSRARTTDDFEQGQNTVDVSVDQENSITPNVTVSLQYLLDSATTRSLEMTVNDNNGNTNTVEILRGESDTIQQTEVTVEKDWLSQGRNTIEFSPTPDDGIYEISGNLTMHTTEEFLIEPID